MWWKICKLSLTQLKRTSSRADKNLLLIIILFLFATQFYIYRELNNSLSLAKGIEQSDLFSGLTLNLSLIITIITLLFLYPFDFKDNKIFLSRLPIKRSEIFKANYYPFLITLLFIYTVESSSLVIAVIKNVELLTPIYIFISTYIILLLWLLLFTFILKCVIEYTVRTLKTNPSFWIEFTALLLVLAAFFISFLIFPPYLKTIHPITWFSKVFLGSYYYSIYIIITLIVQLYIINNILSKLPFTYRNNKSNYKSRKFYNSMILNGFRLEHLFIIRDKRKIQSVFVNTILGILMVMFPYFIFGEENQLEYIHFLIFSIGIGFGNSYIYSIKQVNGLKNYPMTFIDLLIGKNIFYILSTNLIVSFSLLLLKGIGIKITWIISLDTVLRMTVFIMIFIFINIMFKSESHAVKTLVALVSISLYGITITAVNSLHLKNIVILVIIVVLFIVILKRYKIHLEKEADSHDLVQ